MSMYGLVFGQSRLTPALLAVLGNPEVGRLRDAWVEIGKDGEPEIAIYTRNGGGNRDCWGEWVGSGEGTSSYLDESGQCHCTGCIQSELLPKHPLYLRDEDDDFDSTYCTNYFRVPPEWREPMLALAGPHVDTDKRWQDAITVLEQAVVEGDS